MISTNLIEDVKMVNYDTQRNGKTQCFTVPFCFSKTTIWIFLCNVKARTQV